MLEEKVRKSMEALRLAAKMSEEYYKAPLIVTYSGGKDSDVMLDLAIRSGIHFEALNSHTTVDAPQTVYHIQETFHGLKDRGIKTRIDNLPTPEQTQVTMWGLIVKKKMPPTRLARYCCQVLKESKTPNRLAALGIRASESNKRKGRDIFATRGGAKGYAEQVFFRLSTHQRFIGKLTKCPMLGIAP